MVQMMCYYLTRPNKQTGNNMITWNSTFKITPDAGREIIAKNPLKPVSSNSSAKQCKVMKFAPHFDSELIKDLMIEGGDNLTLWAYTDDNS